MEDSLPERGKALEVQHFRKKEQELIDQLRLRAEIRQQRKGLSEVTGIVDDEILYTLHELGYTRDTVALLHLVPMVQVGWASGKVTQNERDLILRAACMRGVAEGSTAYARLEDWFVNRPDEEFFEKTLNLIGHLLQQASEVERVHTRHGLFSQCIRVAAASGRILGLGSSISDEELLLLEHIANALGEDDSKRAVNQP